MSSSSRCQTPSILNSASSLNHVTARTLHVSHNYVTNSLVLSPAFPKMCDSELGRQTRVIEEGWLEGATDGSSGGSCNASARTCTSLYDIIVNRTSTLQTIDIDLTARGSQNTYVRRINACHCVLGPRGSSHQLKSTSLLGASNISVYHASHGGCQTS